MFVADTSVLSSFAAARGLDLLLDVLGVEALFMPSAVQREVQVGLERGAEYLQAIVELVKAGRIRVLTFEPTDSECVASLPSGFGAGEREAVALCQRYNATVLCNDRLVRRYCSQHNIPCLDLARLLRLLWLKGLVTKAKVKTMIVRMEKAEHLVFKDLDRVFAPAET